jgi:hypothetical protein
MASRIRWALIADTLDQIVHVPLQVANLNDGVVRFGSDCADARDFERVILNRFGAKLSF